MRKSIDGLSIIVASNMAKNPSSGEIFLFFNKGSEKIKIYTGIVMVFVYGTKGLRLVGSRFQNMNQLHMSSCVGY